ncbi:MAG TPA: iron-sulfur cluster assembly accessory protein [Gammaproteobacteria bacterium]|jgi:iron-sulfur cluster assembly protein|nr:iron-sulfur cluster assembly accessory protein [Gammaproteobacteria bacterium]
MNPISLTDSAIKHLLEMLTKQKNGVGFRLSLKKTGCSGSQYVPEIIEKTLEEDLHFMAGDLPVYLDPACLSFIEGLTIDYVEDKTMGIKQKRLIYINPHEKNRCGCGESFTTE